MAPTTLPAHPKILFGTATFGMGFDTTSTVSSVLDTLSSSSITHLDTGARYPPTSGGRSEILIGEAKAAQKGYTIDTKIFSAAGNGAGELSAEKINASLEASLKRLGVESVNTLYCHRDDPVTPIEDQARAFDEQFRKGRFKYVSTPSFFSAYCAISSVRYGALT